MDYKKCSLVEGYSLSLSGSAFSLETQKSPVISSRLGGGEAALPPPSGRLSLIYSSIFFLSSTSLTSILETQKVTGDFSSLSLPFLPPVYFHLFPFPNGRLPSVHPPVFISWGFRFGLNSEGGVVVTKVDSHGFLINRFIPGYFWVGLSASGSILQAVVVDAAVVLGSVRGFKWVIMVRWFR